MRTIPGPSGGLATYPWGSEAGSGLGLLLMHADAGRASQWDEVAPLLGAGRHIVAFDFRGHGASEPAADGDYGYRARADDAEAVARAHGLSRFVAVAHSGGAAVALELASRPSSGVAGIVMVDPAADPRALPREVKDGFVADLAGPNGPEVLGAYYASIAGPDAAVRERVLRDAALVHPAARVGVVRALAAWDPEPTLDAFAGPVLVLASPANDVETALHRLRPSIPHRRFADVGHWLQLERPEGVAEAILGFVSTVERGEG